MNARLNAFSQTEQAPAISKFQGDLKIPKKLYYFHIITIYNPSQICKDETDVFSKYYFLIKMAPKRPQEAQGQLENDEKKQRIDSNVEVGKINENFVRNFTDLLNHCVCFQQALVQESALHDAADEELDRSGIPVGWAECPSMGQPIFRFIPMKVPLAPRFDDSIPKGSQFSVEDAIREANALVEKEDAPRRLKMEVAKEAFTPSVCNLVIDLTNSSNYYRMDAFIEQGLMHVKVRKRKK